MRTTLVLPAWIASRLAELARLEVETGAVLLARLCPTSDGGARLLGVKLVEVPEREYVQRESASLLITSSGYVPALALAEKLGAVPIWTHTHPGDGSSPRPSSHDLRVDEQLADLFRLRAASDYYGALIVAHSGDAIRFTGHLQREHERLDIDRLILAGERLRLVWNESHGRPELPALFDRNVRAFGSEVQRALHDLRIAVVGTGGTGSAIAEQLLRLGVRQLLLVDPDRLTESNLTRVYGSVRADIGRPKVAVVRDHLLRIAPEARVEVLKAMVTTETAARSVSQVDIVFGCTDDNAGRLVLSRLATYMLVPVIDCGVLLTSDPRGSLDGIHGRVTVMTPGAACLICRGRIDLARAQSELLSPAERVRLQGEGYAVALPGVEPAVVSFTTAVAAAAVGELLERLTGYGQTPVPSEILLRLHDREISTNVQVPRDGHYCDPSKGRIGMGETTPFLEQTWGA